MAQSWIETEFHEHWTLSAVEMALLPGMGSIGPSIGVGPEASSHPRWRHFAQFKQVRDKAHLLFKLAEATAETPDGIIKEVVYPVVGQKTLQELVAEFKAMGFDFDREVQARMRCQSRHRYSLL